MYINTISDFFRIAYMFLLKGRRKMRINPKVYKAAGETEPKEVQQLEDGKVVEIFIMDDFEDIYNEFTGQSKFAVWSSEDGNNYRLYIESEYYVVLKDLYGTDVNRVWLDFWDECEGIGNKFSRKIVMPLTLVCIAIYMIGVTVWKWPLIVCIAILGTFLILIVFLNRLTKKKIADVNLKSVERIKETLGEDRFRELLEIQRNYPDDFYRRKYPNEFEEEQVEELNEENEEIKEESIPAEITDEKEVFKTENESE